MPSEVTADTDPHAESILPAVHPTWTAALAETPRVEPSEHMFAAEEHTSAWVARMGLVTDESSAQRHAALHCGRFASYAYPRAPAAIVELGADLIGWLSLFDSAYGDWYGNLKTLETALQSFEQILFRNALPEAPTPFHTALADLRARVAEVGGNAMTRRLAYSLRRYFDGCLLEFPYRTTGRSPSLSVYRSLRRWSIGALPAFDVIELMLDRPLDATMTNKESFWRLRDAASTLCAWANDLCAFQTAPDDRDPHNLVSVLRRERNLPPEQAFADAVRLYNADLTSFERALEGYTLAPSTTRLEVAYMRGLCDFIYGSHALRLSATPSAVSHSM